MPSQVAALFASAVALAIVAMCLVYLHSDSACTMCRYSYDLSMYQISHTIH